MGSTSMPSGFDRRRFLALVGAAGATVAARPLLIDLGPAGAAPRAPDPAFPLGVMAGDPHPDGAVIWTRVAPPGDLSDVTVGWQVATDDSFTSVVGSGSATAVAAADHTVHVDVGGLEPDRWYAYRFTVGADTSRTGRLRTAPADGTSPGHLRFAFCSCQQINDSYYVAHTAMAAEGLDFVAHYGDYIYVSDGGTVSLADYRDKWRTFKANDRLQDLHAEVPLVLMWDDGEFINGVDRTFDPPRFANGKQAWFEYAPVARHPDEADRTYREITWGDLARFLLLDVRQYRDPAVDEVDTRTEEGAVVFDPDRTTLGAAQKQWLKDRLAAGGVTWRVLGSPYNWVPLRTSDLDTPEIRENPPPGFHPNEGVYVPNEAMDDYQAERKEILEFIAGNGVENVVVTSGHTHVYFAGDLIPDFDDDTSPIAAKEYVCGSLTADPDPRKQFFPDLPVAEAEAAIQTLEAALMGVNTHLDEVDLLNQGYVVVDITPERTLVEFRVIDTFDAAAVARTSISFEVAAGELPTDRTPAAPPPPPPVEEPQAPPATPVDATADFTG